MATKGILAQTAAKGRRTDTLLGHLTPGDLVVPRERVTPGILASLGADAPRYIAGTEDNSINPKTGLPEFFDGEGGMGSEGSGGGVGADLGNDGGGQGGNVTGFNEGRNPEMGGSRQRESQLDAIDRDYGGGFAEGAGAFGRGWLGVSRTMTRNPEGIFGFDYGVSPAGMAAGVVGNLAGTALGGPLGGMIGSKLGGYAGQQLGGNVSIGQDFGGYAPGSGVFGDTGPSSPNTGGNQTGISAGDQMSPGALAAGALGSAGIGGQGNQGAGPLAQQAQPFPNWNNPYLAPAANDPARWQAMWNQRNRGILGG